MDETAECPTCGRTDFKNARGMQIHHSIAHGESLTTQTLTCAACGKDFERQRSEVIEADRHFCSQDCMAEGFEGCWTGDRNPRFDGGNIELECPNCGDTFEREPNQVHQYNRNYCSKECHHEYRSGLPSEEMPNWQGGKVIVECYICGSLFEVRQYRTKTTDRFTCSDECWSELQSERLTGKNAPWWKGGYHPYGSGWTQKKKESVRERDGRECTECGLTQSQHIEQHGTKLHVHHIVPAREIDDPAERNAMDNLTTLCQPCHLSKRE